MKYISYLIAALLCGLGAYTAQAQSYREVKLHVTHHNDGRINESDSIFVVRNLDELNDILADLGLGNSSSVKTRIEERRHSISSGTGRPMVGVYLSNRSDGLYISSVTKNGAAAEAGLRAGDKILYMNGDRIRREHDLIEVKNRYSPGDVIQVEYERDGRDYETAVRLKGERSASSLKAYLGVVTRDHRDQGTYLSQVVDNTPAQQAELKTGDVIWELGGHRISDGDDLTDALAKHQPGDRVIIKFTRGDRDFESWTVLSARGGSGPKARTIKVPSDKAFLGINMSDHDGGVQITSVVSNSAAQRYGLRRGDVILIMDRDYIRDTDDLSAALRRFRPGQTVSIEFERDGRVERQDVRLGAKETSRTLKVDPQAYFEVRADVYNDRSSNDRRYQDRDRNSRVTGRTYVAPRTDRAALAPKVFEYYPNPNNGRFRLVFELPSRDQVKIRIYDRQEREIYRERITGFDGVYDETIDISRDLDPGTYTLEVSQGGRRLVKQIIVD